MVGVRRLIDFYQLLGDKKICFQYMAESKFLVEQSLQPIFPCYNMNTQISCYRIFENALARYNTISSLMVKRFLYTILTLIYL